MWAGWAGLASSKLAEFTWPLILQQVSLGSFAKQWQAPRKKVEAHTWGLGLEPAHCYFCFILVAKAYKKASLNSKGGEIDSNFWWEELQSHIVRGSETGWKELGHDWNQLATKPACIPTMNFFFKSFLWSKVEKNIHHMSIQPHPQIWIISVFNQEGQYPLVNGRCRGEWKEAY